MGIYIPDMEMPKDCLSCPCMVSDCEGDMCAFQSYEKNATFEDWEQMKASCPLVPVPPHGRLIGADELAVHKFAGAEHDISIADGGVCYRRGWNDAIEAIMENAETIIGEE